MNITQINWEVVILVLGLSPLLLLALGAIMFVAYSLYRQRPRKLPEEK